MVGFRFGNSDNGVGAIMLELETIKARLELAILDIMALNENL